MIKTKEKINSKGITLVSLVITIVIMLILATVAINLILGNNGLFNKSKTSSEEYSKKSVQEELQTAYVSVGMGEINTTLTDEYIKNEMNKEKNNGIQWIENDEDMLIGIYKGYTFIINNHQVEVRDDIKIEYSYIRNANTSAASTSASDPDFLPYRNYIHGIIFETNSNPEEYTKGLGDAIFLDTTNSKTCLWDLSITNDKSVMAYLEKKANNNYLMHIVGKGKIVFPADCSYFFGNFNNIESLTGLDNVSTKHVTNMSYMFHRFGYNAVTLLDLGNNFNTKNVTDMTRMFNLCGYNKMTTLNLGEAFDTSSVTDMNYMFYNCGYNCLTKLDLRDKFNPINVTNMKYMFGDCGRGAMTELNLGSSFNTSNVTNMSNMFSNCGYNALKSLDLGNNFNTSKVTDMSGMFYQCGYNAMESLNLGPNFYTSSIKTIGSIFYYCGYKKLTSLSLGDHFDTSAGKSMPYMFDGCGSTAMTTLDLGPLFVIPGDPKSTNFYGTFNNVGTNNCIIYCLEGQEQKIRDSSGNFGSRQPTAKYFN